MEIVAIIATVILIATLLTLVFSFAAYFVTRAKALMPKKRPASAEEEAPTRIYFERFTLARPEESRPAGRRSASSESEWM